MDTLPSVQFRPAKKTDAAFLLPLIAESSGGVWPAIWKSLAGDTQSMESCAERYLQDPSNNLSVKNAIVTEMDTASVGAVIFYQEAAVAGSIEERRAASPLSVDLFDALIPYRALSDPDSLYISELCFLPEARGRGLGTQLVNLVKQEAERLGLSKVSLRVFSANTGAIALYERLGFKIIDSRAIVPHEDIRVEGSVWLMVCELN